MPSPNFQPSAAAYLMPPLSPRSVLNVQTIRQSSLSSQQVITNPDQCRTLHPNRNSTQTMPPQVNVDLSTVYGKCPAVRVVHQAQPVQPFNAASFYKYADTVISFRNVYLTL
jgi:hypothetical protein